MKRILTVLVMMAVSLSLSHGQVRPGELYDEGAEINAPRLGAQSKVPTGWAGVLPMNTEVFLLMPKQYAFGQIYAMGGEDNYEDLKKRWTSGVELDNGLFIKSSSEPSMRNGSLVSSLQIVGNKNYGGYVEAKCGDFGNCIVAFLFAPPEMVEELSAAIKSFMDDMVFFEPRELDLYAEFDWTAFLGGKYMANYERIQGSKKESEIWLCGDGSFTSKLKNKGVFADQAKDYLGTKKGTWEINGMGPTSQLILSFKNLPTVTLDLLIEEEKIFVNGTRYFFMQDDICK